MFVKTVIAFPIFSIVFTLLCTCYVYNFELVKISPIASATLILLNVMTLSFCILSILLLFQMVEAKFVKLINHSKILLRKQWLYGIVDDFVTKQLPHNVTWGLSLLYALEHKGDRALTSTQGCYSSKLFHFSKIH